MLWIQHVTQPNKMIKLFIAYKHELTARLIDIVEDTTNTMMGSYFVQSAKSVKRISLTTYFWTFLLIVFEFFLINMNTISQYNYGIFMGFSQRTQNHNQWLISINQNISLIKQINYSMHLTKYTCTYVINVYMT